jgi:hypothetical protein
VPSGDREQTERGVVAAHFTGASSIWFGSRRQCEPLKAVVDSQGRTYDMLRCGVHKEDLWQHQPAAGVRPAAGGHVESVR